MTKRSRKKWAVPAGGVFVAIACLVWAYASVVSGPSDLGSDPDARSVDLAADLQCMWQTEPLSSDPTLEGSTLAAIDASLRVFNTVELVGKTGAEVIRLLGSPTRSSQSAYRGQPFWPLHSRGMIYRFDCGSFGWQFNVYCKGDDQLVTEVERRWIH